MKHLFIFFIFACVFLGITNNIQAQSFSMQMTPKFYDVVSQRNKTITLPYTITNLGDPQVITLGIYSLSIKDNEGNYDITYFQQKEGSITFDIAGDSVNLDTPFLLKSKNTLDFELEMTIPESAQETDYLFSIIAELEPQQGFGNSSTITLQGGIGSNIILSVTDNGQLDQQGNIAQYEILSKKKFNLFGKQFAFFNSGEFIPIMLIATNTGANITKTSGSITLIPEHYNTKREHPSFTIPSQYLAAGSQRILKSATNPECNSNENDICSRPHSLIIKAPYIGNYKLAAVVAFGESSQISYGNISFIVFPFIHLLVLIIVLAILFFIFLRLRNKLLK